MEPSTRPRSNHTEIEGSRLQTSNDNARGRSRCHSGLTVAVERSDRYPEVEVGGSILRREPGDVQCLGRQNCCIEILHCIWNCSMNKSYK